MGRARPRRSHTVRVPDPGRGASRVELADDSAQAIGLPPAFADFAPERVARYGKAKVERLVTDPGIVRHRAKIEATIANAQAFLAVQREHGSFDTYLWRFVGGAPISNAWRSMIELPAQTDLSRALSRDLASRGFRFVGPTICYAFMQAVGLVNDHLIGCFRRSEIRQLG